MMAIIFLGVLLLIILILFVIYYHLPEAVVQRCSVEKMLLKILPKFTGKHLWQRLFFNKAAGLRPATLLTLIWVGVLGAHFEVCVWGGDVGVKLPPCLKLVRIVLETWNLVRKFTHICSFRKYTFEYQGLLNFAEVSIFFAKNQHFLAKMVPLLKAIV